MPDEEELEEEELEELEELEDVELELDELELLDPVLGSPGNPPPQAAMTDDNKDTVRILRINYLHFSLSEM